MTDNSQTGDQHLKSIFESTLNRQGHPFQYAVIRRAHELHDERRSPWVFEVSEFPVEVQGYHTRVDFILSQWAESLSAPFRFLVAECKRVNPALSDWMFARAPYVGRGGTTRDILVERVRRAGQDIASSYGRLDGSENIYHLGFEVKSTATGDPGGGGRGAIEDAATQVTRGVNGLIDCLSKHRRHLCEDFPVAFVPAIFTTARLWATELDLANTDIVQGQVALGSVDVVHKSWLWLQYHVSPGLKHSVDRQVAKDEPFPRPNLGHLLEMEYARTIAIVASTGVDDFLASQRWII